MAKTSAPLEVLRISTVVDRRLKELPWSPLEVLRISTVVDILTHLHTPLPLEVLRISTVVDYNENGIKWFPFGSTKNFYCCRSSLFGSSDTAFGSTKNFYCCRSCILVNNRNTFGSTKNFYCCRLSEEDMEGSPLEVLRISTVVDFNVVAFFEYPLEVLRISTVVDVMTRK